MPEGGLRRAPKRESEALSQNEEDFFEAPYDALDYQPGGSGDTPAASTESAPQVERARRRTGLNTGRAGESLEKRSATPASEQDVEMNREADEVSQPDNVIDLAAEREKRSGQEEVVPAAEPEADVEPARVAAPDPEEADTEKIAQLNRDEEGPTEDLEIPPNELNE